jgi:hypothetical protein
MTISGNYLKFTFFLNTQSMITILPNLLQDLGDLSDGLLGMREKVITTKNDIVKSQNFELAAKLREVEHAITNLLTAIEEVPKKLK